MFWILRVSRVYDSHERPTYHSVSDSTDDSRDDELAETPVWSERRNTDNRANNHDESSEQHHPTSSQTFTDEEGEHSSEESATVSIVQYKTTKQTARYSHFVYSGDCALNGRMVDIVLVPHSGHREFVIEVFRGDDTRHETLIITE